MKAHVRYDVLAADTRYGAFDAAVRYELLGTEGVIGRFFSSTYLSDVASTSDLAVFGVGKVFQTPAIAGDVLTISANISRSDTGQAVDLYTAVLGKPFTDVATCADAAFLLVAPSVVDGAAVGDTIFISFLIFRDFFDTVLVPTDQADLSIGKTTTDIIYLSDVFNVLLTTVRANIGLVADSGQLLNQDYVDNAFYFADDYVGTKRTF